MPTNTDPNFVDYKEAKECLPVGKYTEVWGSGSSPYKLKHHPDGAYSCSCMAWRNQSNAGDKRSCKHLKTLRGHTEELKRLEETDIERFIRASSDK